MRHEAGADSPSTIPEPFRDDVAHILEAIEQIDQAFEDLAKELAKALTQLNAARDALRQSNVLSVSR